MRYLKHIHELKQGEVYYIRDAGFNLALSLIVLGTILLLTSISQAETSCKPKSYCHGVNKQQINCVLAHKCQPKIIALTKENDKLKQRIHELEELVHCAKVNCNRVYTQTVTRTIVVREDDSYRNSISAIVPYSRTKMTHNSSETDHVFNLTHEFDLGVMYQRDLTRRIRASAAATLNSTFLLGLGLNF